MSTDYYVFIFTLKLVFLAFHVRGCQPIRVDCCFILKTPAGSRAFIVANFTPGPALRAQSARRDSGMPRGALRRTASVLPSPGVVSRPRQLWWAYLSSFYRPPRLDIFRSHEMKRMNVSNKKCPVVVPVSSITSSQVLSMDAVPQWSLVVWIWCSVQ